MRCDADPSRIPMASPAHQDRWIREEAAMAATAFDTAPNLSRRRLRARSAVAAGQHSECPGILPTVETRGGRRAVSTAQFRHRQRGDPAIFHRPATRKASWVARDAKGEVRGSFTCSRTPPCPLQEGTACRRDTRRYIRPSGSSLISITRAIRWSRCLDRYETPCDARPAANGLS